MHTLRRIDIERREDVLEKIRDFARGFKEKFPEVEMYLYGSFATGEVHENSDIDLVIVGNFKERFFDRIGRVIELTDLPIEPLVYTHEEFEDMKRGNNPFIVEVLKTAIRLV